MISRIQIATDGESRSICHGRPEVNRVTIIAATGPRITGRLDSSSLEKSEQGHRGRSIK